MNAVLPGVLDPVHRAIRGLQQLFGRSRDVRERGDPDRRGQMNVQTVRRQEAKRPQAFAHALGHRQGARRARIHQNDREFVPAEPGDDVGLSRTAADDRRRSTQGRGRRTDEGLDIIARLWRGERVDHEGEFFCLHDAHISPLPVQKKLPLWIGGSSRAAIRRTARIGTGWLGGRETPDDVARVVRGVKAACEETGRRVPDDHYGAAFFYRFGRVDDASVRHHVEASRRRFPDRDPMASTVVGDGETIFGHVQEFVKAGASKFVLRPLGDNDEDLCEQTRILVREVFPAVDALNAAAKMSS